MKGSRKLMKIVSVWNRPILWLTIIASVLTIVGFFSSLVPNIRLGWISSVFSFLSANSSILLLTALTLAIILLAGLTWSLYRRFTRGFREDFKGGLAENWDFVGDWRITESHELLVTNSDPGGLTKSGAFWENYTLECEVKILSKCIGIIVRAQDLNNYYMFQIAKDRIHPHRRLLVPVIPEEDPATQEQDDNPQEPTFKPVKYILAWDIPSELETQLDAPLTDWFKLQITVRGEAVSMAIDGSTVFIAESYLKHATGKIGFRNTSAEKALVRRVRVRLEV